MYVIVYVAGYVAGYVIAYVTGYVAGYVAGYVIAYVTGYVTVYVTVCSTFTCSPIPQSPFFNKHSPALTQAPRSVLFAVFSSPISLFSVE